MLPRRILIVEDDAIDRELLKASFRESNPVFEFAEESAGRSVLRRCAEFHPHCVLLDLNLPDMNGLDVLASLSQSPEPPAVVVITAFGNEQIAVRAMKNGATDYVVKNALTPQTLIHAVENAIEKHYLKTELDWQRRALEQRNQELQAAMALAEKNQERYRVLTEAIPQVVWTATHPDGSVDHISHRWCEATGSPLETGLGTGWLKAVHPEDCDRVESAWHQSVQNCVRFEIECRLGSPTHGYRWYLARAVPQFENESVIRWFGTFTDVEDRRRAEQALLQRQKLESTGLLAGGIAHDFNNLLVGILGGISYALEVLPASHEARRSLQDALLASERAAMLTRQMLNYAGKGKFVVERVDLREVVRSTCDLVRASIPKMIHLNVETGRDTPTLEADSSQIQQIVMNLIINAAEAIGEERSAIVSVRTGAEFLNDGDPVEDISPGLYAVLEVTDTGCGMTEEVQARIFEPFFTTKFTGRGLGLAAVTGIVRSGKGAIWVQSAPGRGSTIRVFLPAKASTSPASEHKISPNRTFRAGTILIVDDEAIVRRTAGLVLERGGFAVQTASGGMEAMECIRQQPHAFDLILLDMNMPGMSGEETLVQLRAINPSLRIVVFTGYSEREVASRLGENVVSGVLQKPFTSHALINRVAEFLNARPTHA